MCTRQAYIYILTCMHTYMQMRIIGCPCIHGGWGEVGSLWPSVCHICIMIHWELSISEAACWFIGSRLLITLGSGASMVENETLAFAANKIQEKGVAPALAVYSTASAVVRVRGVGAWGRLDYHCAHSLWFGWNVRPLFNSPPTPTVLAVRGWARIA